MKRYSGNQVVKKGIYLSLKRRDFVTIESESDLLPGASDERYVKIPPIAMIVLGPIMGLMYVIFLPFISFAMVAGLIANKAWAGIGLIAESLLGDAAAVNWKPSVAYLAWWRQPKKGKKHYVQGKPKEEKKPKTQDMFSELEKEIAQKREEASKGSPWDDD
jgi:hypothetical protein